MAHKGSCHCGKIAYEVEGDFNEVLECNCSNCSRKGLLLWFVPRDKLTLKTPEGNLSEYTFYKHKITLFLIRKKMKFESLIENG